MAGQGFPVEGHGGMLRAEIRFPVFQGGLVGIFMVTLEYWNRMIIL